jgi:hypothetical protein
MITCTFSQSFFFFFFYTYYFYGTHHQHNIYIYISLIHFVAAVEDSSCMFLSSANAEAGNPHLGLHTTEDSPILPG